jgi:hypothetical protein
LPEPDLSFQGVRAAIFGTYAARIEVAQRGGSGARRDIAALVRAIRNERDAALRAFAQFKASAQAALRDRRAVSRHAEMQAQKNGRMPPEARPT